VHSTVTVPLIVAETTNCLVELGSDEGEGVFDIVAFFVEDSCFEVMLRCPEQQLKLSHWTTKAIFQ
jgi:hypothetical protein